MSLFMPLSMSFFQTSESHTTWMKTICQELGHVLTTKPFSDSSEREFLKRCYEQPLGFYGFCGVVLDLYCKAWMQVTTMSKFPVLSKQFSVVIQDNNTDFTLCSYDDFIFVSATQIGKLGTLLQARKEHVYGAQITYTINVLLGKHDEPMLQACARQLIENISDSGSTRPLILSLGLKNHSMETLKGVLDVVIANKIW